VEIGLYDVMGRLIARLDQGERGAGSRTLRWDGRLANGGIVSPGIYFVRVSSDELEVTRKVVLCR
jgi:flagellar hook assembly protein FlgD